MRMQLISAAAQLPVLLSEVRDFLKISHRDEDALIASYIRAAGAACENFTGRKLLQQQWLLTLNDWPNDGKADVIQLSLSPILTVDKIEYWDGSVFQEIAATNYSLDRTSYQAKIIPKAGFLWPDPKKDVEGIKITVSVGFGTDQNEVPHDIRLGLLHWVAAAYDVDGIGEHQTVTLAEKLWQPYRRVAL